MNLTGPQHHNLEYLNQFSCYHYPPSKYYRNTYVLQELKLIFGASTLFVDHHLQSPWHTQTEVLHFLHVNFPPFLLQCLNKRLLISWLNLSLSDIAAQYVPKVLNRI